MRKIYEEIARELNIPLYLVDKVCRYPIRFTKEMMESGKFEGILWPGFGKMLVKPNRIKHADNAKALRIQRNKDIAERNREQESRDTSEDNREENQR